MINFDRFKLKNGLKVLVHKDISTPIVAFNILYNVGARDEDPENTGFAHLFEHLMFGGSVNVPVFDKPLQMVGAENNAFTTNDITNYYITIPKQNLETAFWIESDRMLGLAFSKKSLDVQRKVVMEEFKQRYLNQPYGDFWLHLRPLAYKKHPYKWATIGKELEHIKNAKMTDVKNFFNRYYSPDNAILTVSGNVTTAEIKSLAEKWFGDIPAGKVEKKKLPVEPAQTKARAKTVSANVSFDAIYKVYHMCGRVHKDYHTTDLISDILANGKSSRMYTELVQKKKLFSELDAYILGSLDPGLFVISGKLISGIKMKDAEAEIENLLQEFIKNGVTDDELNKVKNKVETNLTLSEMSVLNKAMNIAFFELIGKAEDINTESEKYRKVSNSDIKRVAKTLFKNENSSTLYYKPISKTK